MRIKVAAMLPLLLAATAPLSSASAQPQPKLASRVRLAPGVSIRLDERSDPPAVVDGRGRCLTFERFFTDPAVFTPGELNNNRYQVGRGYWKPTAYNFFGLAKRGSQAYVGVHWRSPTASFNPTAHIVVFRLELRNGALTASRYAQPSGSYLNRAPKSLLLESLR